MVDVLSRPTPRASSPSGSRPLSSAAQSQRPGGRRPCPRGSWPPPPGRGTTRTEGASSRPRRAPGRARGRLPGARGLGGEDVVVPAQQANRIGHGEQLDLTDVQAQNGRNWSGSGATFEQIHVDLDICARELGAETRSELRRRLLGGYARGDGRHRRLDGNFARETSCELRSGVARVEAHDDLPVVPASTSASRASLASSADSSACSSGRRRREWDRRVLPGLLYLVPARHRERPWSSRPPRRVRPRSCAPPRAPRPRSPRTRRVARAVPCHHHPTAEPPPRVVVETERAQALADGIAVLGVVELDLDAELVARARRYQRTRGGARRAPPARRRPLVEDADPLDLGLHHVARPQVQRGRVGRERGDAGHGPGGRGRLPPSSRAPSSGSGSLDGHAYAAGVDTRRARRSPAAPSPGRATRGPRPG